MYAKETITIPADVLVVGSGGAGLRAAIEARMNHSDVLIVSSSRIGLGNNTAIAGRGFAAADVEAIPMDSAEAHFEDTITGGRFINDQRLVDLVTKSAMQQVYDLQRFGVKFRKSGQRFYVESVPGFRHPRIHMCQGNTLGVNYTRPMTAYAKDIGVRSMSDIFVWKLLEKAGQIMGAVGMDSLGQTYHFPAKSLVLATGGLGNIYLRNDNAKWTTGDGYALAYESGVSLIDMEFIQFYPTSKGDSNGSALITYEPLAMVGARFLNRLNQDLMTVNGIKDTKLMTRDGLSRTIMQEVVEGRGIGDSVMLDLNRLSEEDFRRLKISLQLPYAPEEREVLVAPTAHFCMGGIRVDCDCQTTIRGLFGAGEVCGGIHGANRLAGNALTGCFVMGALAGAKASEYALQTNNPKLSQADLDEELRKLKKTIPIEGKIRISSLHQDLKQVMWHNAGILRNESGLRRSLQVIGSLKEQMHEVLISNPKDLMGSDVNSGHQTIHAASNPA